MGGAKSRPKNRIRIFGPAEKYHDTYSANLQKMIEAKIEGEAVVQTPAPHVEKLVDIMEALKRSLAEKKKPVMTATAAAGGTEAEAPAEPEVKKRARRSKAM